jgi:hypothetical protein
MKPPASSKGDWASQQPEPSTPSPSFRAIVRKSALLNLGMILSGLVMAAYLGRPDAFRSIGILMGLMSVVLWAATFAISAFVRIARIFWMQGVRASRQPSAHATGGGGLVDEWLDGPA